MLRQIGGQALGDAIDEMILLGVAADIGERQHDDRETRRAAFFRCRGRRRLGLGRHADLQRISPDRLGDVLELGRAEVGHRELEPPLHLAIGVLREADRAGRGDPLQPRGDVDAVAHQVAVALLDDVTQMNADAKFDTFVERDTRVALNHRVLHFGAQRTASTTLRNSMTLPSPVRLTMRP